MSSEAPARALAALRAQFPVLERIAYLNAGTNGPLPYEAVTAARVQLQRELEEGRAGARHFERRAQLAQELRAAYAELIGCTAADLALTTSTTDGIARVLLGLDLQPGDEIVTSDEEHPGVLGPLIGQRARGVEVTLAPWGRVADAVSVRTRLAVCSHVSWRSGRFAPLDALRALDVPVVLDGAQGAGAVPVDVTTLGCAAYAAAGQKWLCGPEGSGLLYVSPGLRERMRPPAPGYVNLAEPGAGIEAAPWDDARAYDTPTSPAASFAQASAALDVLAGAEWDTIQAHACELAAKAADALAAADRELLPRDRTTLVTWREPDAPAAVEQLAAAGVIVRSIPGEDLLRASFGGWNSDDDLDRLLAALPR
jgi:selenocysteine lyase/cysteine desulfurase